MVHISSFLSYLQLKLHPGIVSWIVTVESALKAGINLLASLSQSFMHSVLLCVLYIEIIQTLRLFLTLVGITCLLFTNYFSVKPIRNIKSNKNLNNQWQLNLIVIYINNGINSYTIQQKCDTNY